MAFALAAALAGCASGETEPALRGEDPFVEIERRQAKPPAPHAAPRWQPVQTLTGTGPARPVVAIRRDALQWRVRWSCTGGRLTIDPAGGDDRLVDGACPGRGQAFSLRHGRVPLDVRSAGRWRIVVEQQLDTPVHEPPLPQMRAAGAQVIRAGRLYDVERRGRGRVLVYRLESGRLALRLDGFATTTNTDLVLWLSAARRPRTSRAAFGASHTVAAPLRATIGEQNYLLPRGLPEEHLRSLVVWCVPERIAYAAAALRPR